MQQRQDWRRDEIIAFSELTQYSAEHFLLGQKGEIGLVVQMQDAENRFVSCCKERVSEMLVNKGGGLLGWYVCVCVCVCVWMMLL